MIVPMGCTVMKHSVTTQGVVALDGGKDTLQSWQNSCVLDYKCDIY